MYIASFKQLYIDVPLSEVIQGLSDGLRNDIPYPDTQNYTTTHLTTLVIKNNQVTMLDNNYSNHDTIALILELENNIRGVLEKDYNSAAQNGAGIIAVLEAE